MLLEHTCKDHIVDPVLETEQLNNDPQRVQGPSWCQMRCPSKALKLLSTLSHRRAGSVDQYPGDNVFKQLHDRGIPRRGNRTLKGTLTVRGVLFRFI